MNRNNKTVVSISCPGSESQTRKEYTMNINFNFTDNIKDCIYPKDIAVIIKNRDYLREEEESRLPEEANAIYGEDISPEEAETLATPINPEVAYMFYTRPDGLLQPVRATYSRKTLANFARAERKFGHLRPEND